jgi:hypothetical protein
MAFWTDRSVEPKREFRWVLLSANIPKWIVKGVTKPQLTVTDTAHKYHGYTFYYPGTGTWNTIDITLVDPVAPDSSNLIAAIMYRAGYEVPTQPTTVTTISKKNASESLGAIQIQQVDAEGRWIEKWTLNNPFATVADFGGSLSYDNDNLINLKLTLRYDWATLETANSAGQLNGIGSPNRNAGSKYWKP